MKTILFPAHPDSGQEARLQVALDLCRVLDGHLACIDVIELTGYVGDLYAMDSAALIAVEREEEAKNRGLIEARLAREDVSWDWIQAAGDRVSCLVENAAFADLIVASGRFAASQLGEPTAIVGGTLLKSCRPVLAVPPEARGIDLSRPALVAWDGSSPAIAALRAALPLLRIAGSATLLKVGEPADDDLAESAALYLARHGIAATIAYVAERNTIADTLIAEASTAGWIVMGGYGHGRMTQALFGGVTRSMLARAPLPLFIAH